MLDDNIITIERLLAIFIFTLIISGNFLAELFPCNVQKILSNNMLVKHIFGFLTLFFFGALAFPQLANTIEGIFNTIILYVVFLITAKTNYKIWLSIFFIYALLYVLQIVVAIYESRIAENKINEEEISRYTYKIDIMKKLQELCIIFIPILTFFGVSIYMGEKKIEYGKKFSYWTFITGKPSCINKSPNITITQSLKAIFT